MKYDDITGRILKSAFNVHNVLGNGFQEVIYQRALDLEFTHQNLTAHRECEMPIFYRDVQIGIRRVDFLVEGIVIVELKALINLENVHIAQALNYLEAFNIEVGMLINFGAVSLEYHRLTNKKFKPVVRTKISCQNQDFLSEPRFLVRTMIFGI